MRLRVAVSQRVVVDAATGERRDALDQRLVHWLHAVGAIVLPTPNTPQVISAWLAAIAPQAVVLSGGNDLVALGGDAPERDATELALLDYAQTQQLPAVGLCRGMQMMIARDGGRVAAQPNHVAVHHAIDQSAPNTRRRMVNSFHNFAVLRLPPEWAPVAVATDGSVEAAIHRQRGWLGVMWHPEREATFDADDLAWMQATLRSSAVPHALESPCAH